jgi:hypothetical protein
MEYRTISALSAKRAFLKLKEEHPDFMEGFKKYYIVDTQAYPLKDALVRAQEPYRGHARLCAPKVCHVLILNEPDTYLFYKPNKSTTMEVVSEIVALLDQREWVDFKLLLELRRAYHAEKETR